MYCWESLINTEVWLVTPERKLHFLIFFFFYFLLFPGHGVDEQAQRCPPPSAKLKWLYIDMGFKLEG